MVPFTLDAETIEKFNRKFLCDRKNILAQNACTKSDPMDITINRMKLQDVQHVYSHKVDEVKPVTNQNQSGRCWLFAALNTMRIPFCKSMNIEEFEFSQNYLFFWDKIERSNFYLNNILKTASTEPNDGRLLAHFVNDPISDGGQWDMVVNLINKYGIVPKKCFPESYNASSSRRMNIILKSKLHEFTKILRDLVNSGAGEGDVKSRLKEMMSQIYTIVGICLGIPEKTFTWEYYDKSKQYQCIGPITGKDFYDKYVRPVYDVDQKVCLTSDPRATSPYHHSYTVEYLGNIVGMRDVLYNNQPIEFLMEVTAKSIQQGEPVWMGCDVGKRFYPKLGLSDLKLHDYSILFNCDVELGLDKADRLIYGESMMTHAMVFTAVNINASGKVTKFRVENSWSDDRGEKGYLLMTPEWFNEFVYEVVVDSSLVDEKVLRIFKEKPTVLPAWDPMGTLAKSK